MKYTPSQCYRDVEQIIKHALNTFDFRDINNWFENYESEFIQAVINMCKTKNIYSVKYINSVMFGEYNFFKALKESGISSQPVIQKENAVIEEVAANDVLNNDNMCLEPGWEGCTIEERDLLIAQFKHALYPNEFPDPLANKTGKGETSHV